jgi:hypothetical protein
LVDVSDDEEAFSGDKGPFSSEIVEIATGGVTGIGGVIIF